MKKVLFVALICIFACSAVFAQNQGRSRGERPDFGKMIEKQAEKIAQDLALEDAVSAKFVPLYVEYRTEMMNLRRGSMNRGDRDKKMTDEEVEARILAGFDSERKTAELKESYYKKFRELMNPSLIQKMYGLEMRGMMPQGGQGGHGYPQGGPGGGRPSGMGGGFGGPGGMGGGFGGDM